MNTDRELLELAAKAARIELRWHPDGTAYSDSRCKDYWGVWNPLTDDGDALRLVVKLNLLVHVNPYVPTENAWGHAMVAWRGMRDPFEPERFTENPCAATRRAIVRAAAEIGRSMA